MSELQLQLTPTDIAVAITSQQLLAKSACAAVSSLREDPGAKYLLMPKRNTDAQMELATVIRHKSASIETGDTHKPAGIRLAKMLRQYDDSPSSQLWSEIQGLAREILK